MSILSNKAPVDRAYRKFERKASFGDFLMFSERLGEKSLNDDLKKDSEDKRTLTYIATNELGMDVPVMQFSASPQYMLLEMIHNTKRQVEEILKKQGTPEFDYTTLSGKLQGLMGMLGQYETFNQPLPEEQKINYRKSGSDFIKPVRVKRTDGARKEKFDAFVDKYKEMAGKYEDKDRGIFLDEILKFAFETPTSTMEFMSFAEPGVISSALQSLYEADKTAYKRFISGFTKYADYLVRVAARKSVDGITLKQNVRDPVLLVTQEYVDRAKQLNHQVAQDKLIEEFDEILSGRVYTTASV